MDQSIAKIIIESKCLTQHGRSVPAGDYGVNDLLGSVNNKGGRVLDI